MILGNPPWLKIVWNESGILGERNPILAVRKISASDLTKLRADAFERFDGLKEAWTDELQEAEGTQNFLNATQNYPLLKGMPANLYKCFLPLALGLNSTKGVTGLLHPEGPYEEPKGGALREILYPRLCSHFQFQNQEILFPIGHRVKYSINIYGEHKSQVAFDNLSNLFVPSTVDACYQHDGSGLLGGIKNQDGKWDISGHRDRIVKVNTATLSTFAQLYDVPGTSETRARLPAIHAGALNRVLGKLAAYPRRLGDLEGDYFSTEMWNETAQQKDGTITRRPNSDSGFAKTPNDWVLSGPHFFVANPHMKTPRKVCTEKGHYDIIDLETLPNDYLPRTNYMPMAEKAEYLRRTPRVSWLEATETQSKPVTDYYRYVHRRRIGASSERTLTSSIIPPGVGHINTIVSLVFKNCSDVVNLSGITSSCIFDFFVKSTGLPDLWETTLQRLPFVESNKVTARALVLNCLTTHYAPLWSRF